jgi:hypothetical protein
LLYAFPKHSSWVQISINNLNCAIGIAQDCWRTKTEIQVGWN